MVQFLGPTWPARKRVLWAAGCCRLVANHFPDEPAREMVRVAQRQANGRYTGRQLAILRPSLASDLGRYPEPLRPVLDHLVWAGNQDRMLPFIGAYRQYAESLGRCPVETLDSMARILREVVPYPGPEHQPVIPPVALTANGGAAPQVADTIRCEGTYQELPCLADALDEGGCEDWGLLSHLRDSTIRHLPGCWAVDAVLGLN